MVEVGWSDWQVRMARRVLALDAMSIDVLEFIARFGGVGERMLLSVIPVGIALDLDSETVSRRLLRLKQSDLLLRWSDGSVMVTQQGWDELTRLGRIGGGR